MDGLSFRKKGLSRGLRRRILLLAGVFIISMVVFSIALNFHPAGRSENLSAGSLPIVYVSSDGERISSMHGYLAKMDGCYMRESIVPIEKDRTISIDVTEYDGKVKSGSYEILSMDTERKIAEEDITGFEKTSDGHTAKLSISNLLENDDEYLLVITLKVDDEDVRYYTRITRTSNEHISECVEFAENFREAAINGDTTFLSGYLETDEEQNMDTLAEVTIRSSESQVAWKAFKGDSISDVMLHFTEIGSDYAGMIFDYQRKDESGNTFVVDEYFKVRYSADKMYLLDYERDMGQIHTDSFTVNEDLLSLGVIGSDVEYISNDTGTVTAFVSAGEVFEYNVNKNEINKVFGFRQDDLSDEHANYDQHGIKLLNIDENGGLNFVVYGYMNGGMHEGYAGVNLYRYDVSKDKSEEQFFIATPRPYPILEAGFSELLYKNGSGDFYIMMDGTLTKVNGSTAQTSELLTSLAGSQYAVSASGRYIAYIENEMADDTIIVYDLENESTYEIKSDSENESLRPLAFLEDNLAYGKVRASDIGTDAAGNELYPCYSILIRDATSENGEVLKEYEKDGVLVSDVTANSYTLYLKRVVKSGEIYNETSDDTIQNSSGEPNKSVLLVTEASDEYGLLTSIQMTEASDEAENTALSIKTVDVSAETPTAVAMLESSELHENYYVYVGSRVLLATADVTDAISEANKEMGVVIDNRQRNIWSRTRPSYKDPFKNMTYAASDAEADNVAKCLSAILTREDINIEVHGLLESGETPISVLSGALEDATTLDLTGCSVEEVLYFVGLGNPVYAYLGNNDARLIVGYDAANVYVYQPGETQNIKMSRDDAGSLFEQSGNIFISYIKD